MRDPKTLFEKCKNGLGLVLFFFFFSFIFSFSKTLLMLFLVFFALVAGYKFQFSITEPFAPSFVQFNKERTIFGSSPFGFKGGQVEVSFDAWSDASVRKWNASVEAQDFFVDFNGHWRPPVKIGPVPRQLGVAMCSVDIVRHGVIGDLNNEFRQASCLSWDVWNTSSSFHLVVKEIPDVHLVILVYSLDIPFSMDLLELTNLRLSLTNLAIEGDRTQLSSGQNGVPELFTVFLALWCVALALILANQVRFFLLIIIIVFIFCVIQVVAATS